MACFNDTPFLRIIDRIVGNELRARAVRSHMVLREDSILVRFSLESVVIPSDFDMQGKGNLLETSYHHEGKIPPGET